MANKREKPQTLKKLLEYDIWCSKKLFVAIESSQARDWKTHCKLLEKSCNGIIWLVFWLASVWVFSKPELFELQLNFIFGLILDIILVAVLKAYCRRCRPSLCNDMMMAGPDKFSFPSGHASRAAFVLIFFTCVYPLSVFWWLPIIAWTIGVLSSRLILQRHYILDVIGGISLGILEGLFMGWLWLSQETAESVFAITSSDGSIEMEV